jgi:hypothetical protein
MIPVHGVGFWKGAGIPTGPRSQIYVECGCCGAWHRADFAGDCREDRERFADPPEDAEREIALEEQMEEEQKDEEPADSRGPLHDASDEDWKKWAEHYDKRNGGPEDEEDR